MDGIEPSEKAKQGQDFQMHLSNDPIASYNAKLVYRYHCGLMDLQKNEVLLEQRLNFESRYLELTERYRTYKKLMGCTIYSDQNGDLMYALTNSDNQTVGVKRLLNVSGFSARRLFSCYPKQLEVLEITWISQSKNDRIFWKIDNAGSGMSFLRRLKSKGISFLVSGRTEKQAAEALLAYTYMIAHEQEIPYQYGWGLNLRAKWHFARRDELTMLEVMRDV